MVLNPFAGQTILAVFPVGEDRTVLQATLEQAGWHVRHARSFEEAQAVLSECAVAAVISESRLPGGHTWKDVLGELQTLPGPPPLIVADRLADERLWAEVLNLGGHDLLTRPFEAGELLHAVSTACRFENVRPGPADAHPQPPKSEAAGLS